MSSNPNQPRPYDAVIGGQTPPPVQAAVLGGLEGVKQRLASASDAVRIAALPDAAKYGQSGLALIDRIVKTEVGTVQQAACDLLWKKADEAARLKLTESAIWPSKVGENYTRLRDLLAAGNWKAADRETWQLMLKVANRETPGWFDIDSINQFPCTDLRTIDKLWIKYTNGRFGFSVQKRIYDEVGQNYGKLIDSIGWRKGGMWTYYSALTFNLKAPSGHLPLFGWFAKGIGQSFLAQKLVECHLS